MTCVDSFNSTTCINRKGWFSLHFIKFFSCYYSLQKTHVLSRVLIVWGLRMPIARNKDKGEHSYDNQVPSLIGWKNHCKDWDLSTWLSSLTECIAKHYTALITSEFAALLRLIWRGEDIFLKGKGICCFLLLTLERRNVSCLIL